MPAHEARVTLRGRLVTVSLAAWLKRDEPAKAGSFRIKFWKVLAEAKVLRKVLPKVLKGT
jgi:hypothetical protein